MQWTRRVETLNPNYEMLNKPETQMFECSKHAIGLHILVSIIRVLIFAFVSDFVFRISDLL